MIYSTRQNLNFSTKPPKKQSPGNEAFSQQIFFTLTIIYNSNSMPENREIKFRVYNPSTNDMLYSDEADGETWLDKMALFWMSMGLIQNIPLPELSYMQYTGRKDKDGKEIYDGDVLSFNSGQLFEKDQTVTAVYPFSYKSTMRNGYFHSERTDHQGNLLYYKVVWNIYQNPDLIKTHPPPP